jgi:hypothetical protein
MASTDRDTAVAAFATLNEVERAIAELRRAGFSDEQIGVVSRHQEGMGARVEQGVTVGALGGGAIGTLAGLAMAAGTIAPIGPAVMAGGLVALLTGTLSGAAVGGLAGALVGLGVSEEGARFYESEVAAGRYLVTVRADGQHNKAVDLLRRSGGRHLANRRESP